MPEFWSFPAGVGLGAGLTVIIMALLRIAGVKLIEGFIDLRLQKKMAEYEHRFNLSFSRISKIHEIEIEVLPTAWQKLSEAAGHVNQISSVIRPVVNISSFPDEEMLIEHLSEQGFSKHAIRDLVEAYRAKSPDFDNRYEKYHSLLNIGNAEESVREFHNYLRLNKVFLANDVFIAFENVDKFLWEKVQDIDIDVRFELGRGTYQIWQDIRNELTPRINEVEECIRRRIKFPETEEN